MTEPRDFSSPSPQVSIRSIADAGVRAPRMALALAAHVRRCEVAARHQGLRADALEDVGLGALLGFTEDRSVIGLQRQNGIWRISRVPVPSALVSVLALAPLTNGMAQPLWVRLLRGYVGSFKHGKEIPVWDARHRSMGGAINTQCGRTVPRLEI